MIAGALDAAVAEALGAAPGLTGVAKEMSSLAESPEPYVFSVFMHDFGMCDEGFHTLLPFELSFPALVLPAGCRELTIKSTCRRQANICVGGDVRYEGCQSNEDYLAYHTGELSLPPIERTFTAPRTSPSGISYFSVADLARALTELPEVYRQVGRLTGLCAFNADNDGALSYGKFDYSGDGRYVRWGACALWLETWEQNAKFSAVDGRSVLDVQWSVVCDGWGGSVEWTEPESCPCLEGATLNITHYDEPKSILEYWCADAHEREDMRQHAWPPPKDDFSSPLHDLRRSVVDAKRWAPGWKLRRWQEYYHTGPGFPEAEGPAQDPRIIGPNSKPMSPIGSIGGSSLFERMERDANSSIDSSDDEASTSSGFGALLAGRDPPADPGPPPPGFAEEMAARVGIPRPAAAADPEEDS